MFEFKVTVHFSLWAKHTQLWLLKSPQYIIFYFVTHQVLIFAEKKSDVDDIHEYLLLKGVEAVAIHGGKGNLEAGVFISGFFPLYKNQSRGTIICFSTPSSFVTCNHTIFICYLQPQHEHKVASLYTEI